MTTKLWLELGAAVFLLGAAILFGPEAAQSLFGTLAEFVTGDVQ